MQQSDTLIRYNLDSVNDSGSWADPENLSIGEGGGVSNGWVCQEGSKAYVW